MMNASEGSDTYLGRKLILKFEQEFSNIEWDRKKSLAISVECV